MHKRVYRYNKPEAAVLVDILNHTNKTNYRVEQLEFETPVRIDHTRTTVQVSERDVADELVNLKYQRYDLGFTFSRNPLVIDVDQFDDQSLIDGILKQHRVLFELGGVDVVRTPLDSELTQQILDGLEYSVILDPSTVDADPISVDRDGIYNFTLRARPESLLWVGETPLLVRRTAELIDRSISTQLSVHNYLAETRDNKVPIELIYDLDFDASEHGSILAKLAAGDILNELSEFISVAKKLTNDKWVAVEGNKDFNLKGATVVYNGYNVDEYFTGYKEYSHVIVVRLADTCLNLKGLWQIHYKDPTVFTYHKHRIDRQVQPDQ